MPSATGLPKMKSMAGDGRSVIDDREVTMSIEEKVAVEYD